MKARLLSKLVTFVLSLGVLMVASSITLAAQQATPKSANKPASTGQKKKPSAMKPAPAPAPTAGQETKAPAAQEKKAPMKKKRRPRAAAVPKGPQGCIDRLIKIASADPLPAYGGQAEQIVNNGLLWDNPKSKCSIGSDQALKSKVSSMVTAWRMKDAEKVRSLLQEIKSAAPAG